MGPQDIAAVELIDLHRRVPGAITGVFAPDMVWRIEGHPAASKES
jgi:hypothetical protein